MKFNKFISQYIMYAFSYIQPLNSTIVVDLQFCLFSHYGGLIVKIFEKNNFFANIKFCMWDRCTFAERTFYLDRLVIFIKNNHLVNKTLEKETLKYNFRVLFLIFENLNVLRTNNSNILRSILNIRMKFSL